MQLLTHFTGRPVCIKIQKEKLDSRDAETIKISKQRKENPDGLSRQVQSLSLSKNEFDSEFSLCFRQETFLSFMFSREVSLANTGVSGNTWL